MHNGIKRATWKKGDTWLTPHFQIFQVVKVHNQIGILEMIFPIKTRPATQGPVPPTWVKVHKRFVKQCTITM
jgi:hypothetical protein